MVANRYFPITDGYLDGLAEAHHIFVDRVIKNFFQQDIDTIIGIRTIAQLSDVHTRTTADVFHPVERLDIIVAIRRCVGLCVN